MDRKNKDLPGSIKIILSAAVLLLLCACSGKDPAGGQNTSAAKVPDKHTIPYDETMKTVSDDLGADAFDSGLDEPDSKYYVINDYYNMKSSGSLHIIPEFETYQQTTEYSCGPASAVMVLNHYGNHDYNELEICRLADTDSEGTGTSVEGLAGFFEGIGWKTEAHAGTALRFETIEDAESFIIDKIDEGTPVMVDWEDWRGHWQVIIGIDTCRNDSPFDDVLIMADPYDVTDHYQDGYYNVPFGRFFDMWREGPCARKTDPYVQPFVIAAPSDVK